MLIVELKTINNFFNCITEAAPASEAGLKTSLVAREGSQLTDDDKQKFNVIDTFSELTSATNGECL